MLIADLSELYVALKTSISLDCFINFSGDIGEGSVIGAGAVVVKPIPEYSVAVGNPARVIRKRGE